MPNDRGMISGPANARPLTPVDFLDRAVQAFAHRPATMVDALRGFCRDNLAHFRVPRAFVFAELPRTATGKIQKFALRATAKGLLS